jgi:synaptojanin
MAQNKGAAFVGLSEPEITFLPTYKYDHGTNTYDTRCVPAEPTHTDSVHAR